MPEIYVVALYEPYWSIPKEIQKGFTTSAVCERNGDWGKDLENGHGKPIGQKIH